MKWPKLDITIKENSYFAEGFFGLSGSPLEPTESCTGPSGFFEQRLEWVEWEGLKDAWTFTCARKIMPCYSPKAPSPGANGSNTTALEAVDFRGAPEAVRGTQVYCLSSSKRNLYSVTCVNVELHAVVVLKEDI